jgi:hypothetical protein
MSNECLTCTHSLNLAWSTEAKLLVAEVAIILGREFPEGDGFHGIRTSETLKVERKSIDKGIEGETHVS